MDFFQTDLGTHTHTCCFCFCGQPWLTHRYFRNLCYLTFSWSQWHFPVLMSPLQFLTHFYYTQPQKEKEVLTKPSLILLCSDICEMSIFVPSWVLHPPIPELEEIQLYSECVYEPPEVHQLLLLVSKQIQSLCQEGPYLHCWAYSLVQLSVFSFKARMFLMLLIYM